MSSSLFVFCLFRIDLWFSACAVLYLMPSMIFSVFGRMRNLIVSFPDHYLFHLFCKASECEKRFRIYPNV